MEKRNLYQMVLITILLFSAMSVGGCGKKIETAVEDNVAETGLVINQAQIQSQTRSALIETNSDTLIEIREKMFMTQISDIYYNFDEYADKIIKVEGIFGQEESMIDDSLLNTVFRYGPGCCGNDGWGGFYLIYEGVYPEIDAWIEVTGTVELEQSEQYTMMYLRVNSLEEKEERGAEYVER